jgi:pilus assembly protein Flp/PilA
MLIDLSKRCLKQVSGVLSENGQDIVEYALVVALMAAAAVAGTHTIANSLNTVFTNIGNALTNS